MACSFFSTYTHFLLYVSHITQYIWAKYWNNNTWLCTYLWLVLFETYFWQILQNPALVPWVVLEDGGPNGLELPNKPSPHGDFNPRFWLSSLLLLSLVAVGKFIRIWVKCSWGLKLWERLLRRFFFNGLSNISKPIGENRIDSTVGQKILKRPGQKNSWNQINQFHELFFWAKFNFFPISKMTKNQFLNRKKVQNCKFMKKIIGFIWLHEFF